MSSSIQIKELFGVVSTLSTHSVLPLSPSSSSSSACSPSVSHSAPAISSHMRQVSASNDRAIAPHISPASSSSDEDHALCIASSWINVVNIQQQRVIRRIKAATQVLTDVLTIGKGAGYLTASFNGDLNLFSNEWKQVSTVGLRARTEVPPHLLFEGHSPNAQATYFRRSTSVSLSFSPLAEDSSCPQFLLSILKDTSLVLIDANTLSIVEAISKPIVDKHAVFAAWTSPSSFVVAAHTLEPKERWSLHTFCIDVDHRITQLEHGYTFSVGEEVTCFASSVESNVLAVGLHGGTVLFLRPSLSSPISLLHRHSLRGRIRVRCAAFSSNGRQIAVPESCESLSILSIENEGEDFTVSEVSQLHKPDASGGGGEIRSICWSPTDKFIWAVNEGSLWRVSTQIEKAKFSSSASPSSSMGPLTKKPRESLPIHPFKSQLLDAIRDNQVLVVSGEQGSGKSTQIAQYLAESGAYPKAIACAQMSCAAAKYVATQVANQFGCEIGQEVGYLTSTEDVTTPSKTVIKYLSHSLLLHELLSDADLSSYSVIILNDAQERTIEIDVLFGLLQSIRSRRKNLKLIINTSAVASVDKISLYFSAWPIFTIPSKSFPVNIHYLREPTDDRISAACDTVLDIQEPGDILVFVPGHAEIDILCSTLAKRMKSSSLMICPVYSYVPSDIESRVFEAAPIGTRKVIITTGEVAESLLSFEGIVHVVDIGLNANGVPISTASAKRRAASAGRSGQPGNCYRIYSEAVFKFMSPAYTPIMSIHADLNKAALLVQALAEDDVITFKWIDEPSLDELMAALSDLHLRGALTAHEYKLTSKGKKMLLQLLLQIEEEHPKPLAYHQLTNCGVDISPCGRFVASGDFASNVFVWPISSASSSSSSDIVHDNPMADPVVALHLDGDSVRALHWHESDNSIYIGTLSGHVYKWAPFSSISSSSSSPAAAVKLLSLRGPVATLRWSCRSSASLERELLAIGTCDGELAIWDPIAAGPSASASPSCIGALSVQSGRVVYVAQAHHHPESDVWSCEWSPCGQFIATASEDRSTAIWKLNSPFAGGASSLEKVSQLRGHEAAVTCVDWTHQVLATCSDDRSIRLYNPESFALDRILLTSGLYVTYLAVEPVVKGRDKKGRLACVTEDGFVYVFCLECAEKEGNSGLLDHRRIHAGSVEGLRWKNGMLATTASDCFVALAHPPDCAACTASASSPA